ncbi:MAG: UTP--glucose-1-phosphate uridylyltransferase [Deltaproteobacteria bacterium]|jgi:UTP--glucose-1-phosphate uridylyltransferase|nr:UTP--glucose-1-phosphate uridylyltransferase [Deltaproteobacteria bacterium]
MAKVRKAVIPAAGLGTRFLPATKTVPKEMLPIVDRPILLYVVEEAVRAGIEDIVIVAGRGKTAIEDFFDVSYELEDKLERDGKHEWLTGLKKIRAMANIISIRQKQPLGLGHAVGAAAPVIGSEPFAVLLGDEIMVSRPDQKTVTEQLVHRFHSSGISTVAVMEVPLDETSKYGIVEGDVTNEGGHSIVNVRNVIEKPARGQTTSRFALPGRYVFDAEIFEHIRNTKPGKLGEIQLTDAMIAVAKSKGLHATTFEARRFDAGDKLGYLMATIEMGLEHPELSTSLRTYLKGLVARL